MALNIGVNFNGKHIVHPGAHSRVLADALSSLSSSGIKRLAILGTSEGGEPGKVKWFDNPSDAKAHFRGGDLVTAGELAWSPSNDGVGAGEIGFLRIQDAKKATLVKGGLTFKSKDWGQHTNEIQVKLEEGTAPNSKKLTVADWTQNAREVYDNIGPIFTIKYVGTEATMNLNIVESNGVKTLALNNGTNDVLTYILGKGEFSDINRLVYDINEHVDFEASMTSYGNKNINPAELDLVEGISLKSGQYTVTALKGDTVHQIRFSDLIEVEVATGEYPAVFDFTNLTGGTNGDVPASWAEKLDLLYGEGIRIVVPLTADEAIHAEVATFIQNQSNNERNPMVGFYGGRLGETVDEVISRALTLNTFRAVQCYPGIAIDSSGTYLPSYFTAAQVAGRYAGKTTGDPITLDSLAIVGVEKVLKSVEVNRLIQAGVTVVEFNRQANTRGYRIAQGITTYQHDSNPSYRELSMVDVTDVLNTELNDWLEQRFAGGKGTVSTVSLIKNETQSFLDKKKSEEVIVDYDPNSVQVILEDDVVRINYSAIPVGAINYILITAKYYKEQILA